MDLLENYEQLPEEVQNILLDLNENETYENCAETVKKLEAVGYTADYDLSGTLFDLKKL